MPTEFVRPSNPTLDQVIAQCRTTEEIREATKQWMESQGTIQRERGEGIGERVLDGTIARRPQHVAPMPASSGTGSGYRVIYPHLNDRFELTGTEEEMDRQEAAIRAKYQRQ